MPGREKWAALAVKQFLRQTFHRSERAVLMIAGPGAAGIGLAGDERIHVIDLECDIRPLGAKRNCMCELARSEWIAHWDDDDWRADNYLEQAISDAYGASLAARQSAWFDDGRHAWIYQGGPACGVGSTLVYRSEFWRGNPFPALQIGEDNAIIRRACASGSALLVPLRADFVARDHGKNTSGRNREASCWRRRERSDLPGGYLHEAESWLLRQALA